MFRPEVEKSCSCRKSTYSTSIASEDATICTNVVEEKSNLEGELFRLRESTRTVLRQSWNEAKMLQKRCAVHLQFTSELEQQLTEAKNNENSGRIRCLAVEARLQSSRENKDNQLKTNEKPNLHKKMHTWKRGPSGNCVSLWYSESILSTTQTPDESARPANTQKDDHIKVLLWKLSSRDEAITSLEQTLERHVKDMQYAKAEIVCSIDTQRIKEKRLSESHRRREQYLEKVIALYRKRFIIKGACLKALRNKLSDCRIIIEELTDKLPKVLQILIDLEKQVASSNYNLKHSRSS